MVINLCSLHAKERPSEAKQTDEERRQEFRLDWNFISNAF